MEESIFGKLSVLVAVSESRTLPSTRAFGFLKARCRGTLRAEGPNAAEQVLMTESKQKSRRVRTWGRGCPFLVFTAPHQRTFPLSILHTPAHHPRNMARCEPPCLPTPITISRFHILPLSISHEPFWTVAGIRKRLLAEVPHPATPRADR